MLYDQLQQEATPSPCRDEAPRSSPVGLRRPRHQPAAGSSRSSTASRPPGSKNGLVMPDLISFTVRLSQGSNASDAPAPKEGCYLDGFQVCFNSLPWPLTGATVALVTGVGVFFTYAMPTRADIAPGSRRPRRCRPRSVGLKTAKRL
jgi:hypothetical protein